MPTSATGSISAKVKFAQVMGKQANRVSSQGAQTPPACAPTWGFSGGPYWIRTSDLCRVKAAL